MKKVFFFVIHALFLPGLYSLAIAQSTSVVLPTSDNTSAFVVEDADGTAVFSAGGGGDVEVSGDVSAASFSGDGSTLSNVVPIMAVTQGDIL